MTFLSDQQIEEAKKQTKYTDTPGHEHPDCIRIAYEWLDAQINIEGEIPVPLSLKGIIRRWGGYYVSRADVDVAAYMHPRIKGEYPYYNIDANLTRPNRSRLDGIGEAKDRPHNRNVFLPPNYLENEDNHLYTRNE